MKNRLIMPIFLIIAIGVLWQSTTQNDFIYESFEGFITKDEEKANKFYLQENEGGLVIELKFTNEDLTLLNFEDFGYVSVDGHFNLKENYIIVNEITGLVDHEELVMNTEKQ